eukprot:1314257-Prymnesium_polylepis.1
MMWMPRVGTCRALQGYDAWTWGTGGRPNVPPPGGLSPTDPPRLARSPTATLRAAAGGEAENRGSQN